MHPDEMNLSPLFVKVYATPRSRDNKTIRTPKNYSEKLDRP